MLRFINTLKLISIANAILTVPGPPSGANLNVIGSREVQIDLQPPLDNGGSDITSYSIEWDTRAGTAEVQRVSTMLNLNTNEIQSITTSVEDVDEVQIVRTFATPQGTVQSITVSPPPGEINLDSMYKYSLKLDTTVYGGSVQYSGDISATADPEGSSTSLAEILGAMANVDYVPSVMKSEMNADGGFTYMVTFHPSMKTVPVLELYVTDIPVFISLIDEANLLQGYFRLEYDREITDAIPYDASESVMQKHLMKLSSIDSVQVIRSNADDQNGYSWRIQFTSDVNGGNLSDMIIHSDGLKTTNLIDGAGCMIASGGVDGSFITGSFVISHGGESTPAIPSSVEAHELKTILESLNSIGIVDIERSKSSPVGGFTWTIYFREDIYGTNRGDVLPLVVTSYLSGGSGFTPVIKVSEVRKGTWQEVQRITISAGSAKVDPMSAFRLSFGGQSTNEILALPLGGTTCLGFKAAKQVIRTSTEDTSTEGGDNTVSPLTFFVLSYGNYETSQIPANNGSCEYTATIISHELSLLPSLHEVSVIGKSTNQDDEGCQWEVSLLSSVGNPGIIQATLFHEEYKSGPGTNVTVGDYPGIIRDKISISQPDAFKSDINLIQEELSKLAGIGIITVSSESETPDEFGQCSWKVTFETKAGNIASLLVSGVDSEQYSTSATMLSGDVISVEDDFVKGTSIPLSGDFTLEFAGQRTPYLPFDAGANEVRAALAGLFSTGYIQVNREGPDENFGYNWDVTFVESLGTVDLMIPDFADLKGTASQVTVSRLIMGQEPPFNGPDYDTYILESAAAQNPILIGNLNQGIEYYFRVTAFNSLGAGVSVFTLPPSVKPLPQAPSSASHVDLNVIDGSSIDISIHAPISSGGGSLTSVRVDYSNEEFRHERQRLSLECSPISEIQRISTNAPDLNEIQYIVIDSSYQGNGFIPEIQRVSCDASGGEFGLGFNNDIVYIPFDANEVEIKQSLERIVAIGSVNVSFENDSQFACAPGASSFLVTFESLHGMSGDIPMMKSVSNSLSGARYIEISEAQMGDAPPSGFFALSFRGSKTNPIPLTESALDISQAIQTELLALDTIETDGIQVMHIPLSHGPELVFQVEFIGYGVGGDVSDLIVAEDSVHGSSAKTLIFSDGDVYNASNGVDIFTSKPGNSILGYFELRLRGHITEPIQFNASADQMKAALERLPNVGTVHVEVGARTNEDGYSWEVTFLSNPGYYPIFTKDVDLLEPVNYLYTSRMDSDTPSVLVEEIRKGAEPLRGQFMLLFDQQSTPALDAFISARDLKVALEALPNIGSLSVIRTETQKGYIWDIDFESCSFKNGQDVCNDGNLLLLQPVDLSLSGCGGVSLAVEELVAGSDAGDCQDLDDGKCTIVQSTFGVHYPLNITLEDLIFGKEYFVQVRFRSEYGYSYRTLSHPLSGTPKHNAPGRPPPPYLIQSTATSITIGWETPNLNGGSPIIGYELWINDFQGNEYELLYDGMGSPDVFQYKVSTANIGPKSQIVESGRQYQFQIRAANNCKGKLVAPCYGPFSDTQTYTVRDPRVPQPPLPPKRDASTVVNATSVSISISWERPYDNGGSPISGYIVFIKDAHNVVKSRPVSATSFLWTEKGLDKGESYHFYVVAMNAVGRSGNSGILTVIGATYPGLGDSPSIDVVQEQIRPSVVDASETSMIVTWKELESDFDGGIPISGYKLYMYTTNDSLSQDLKARHEVQHLIKPSNKEVTGTFTLTFKGEETAHIYINATSLEIKRALENLASINIVRVNDILDGWEVHFLSDPTDMPLLIASPGRLLPVGSSVKVTEHVRGDSGMLVYEGLDLRAKVRNLVPGGSYSFKVAAFNAIGNGLLSHASTTVSARSGASAAQTTASGGALSRGIAGIIPEIQIVSFVSNDCEADILSLSFVEISVRTENLCGASALEFEIAIEKLPSIGDTHVTRRNLSSVEGLSGYEWSVTFISHLGDVPMLLVDQVLTKNGRDSKGEMGSDALFVVEFLKGRTNEFTIEPKRTSGAVVTDVNAVARSRGDELFFTELWNPNTTAIDGSHEWISTGGVAKYNPVRYEEQVIHVPEGVMSFTLTMDTSIFRPLGRIGGYAATTSTLNMPLIDDDLKKALDLLDNVRGTQVTSMVLEGSTAFTVTFTSVYGEMPLLTASNSRIIITRTSDQVGVTEIQTVTSSVDAIFINEVQRLSIFEKVGSIKLRFRNNDTKSIPFDLSDANSISSFVSVVEGELNLLDGVKVTVSHIDSGDTNLESSSNIFMVTFLEPHGNVELLQSDEADTQKQTIGYSPIEGSFVLEFNDEYTIDIPYDASAKFVKQALESLSTIEEVNVQKHYINTGFQWDISFTGNLGNLRNIRAFNSRFEVQKVSILGGYPTPLGGSFFLLYNGESTSRMPFDASSDLIKSNLEALTSIGRVDVQVLQLDNGQREWLITFRVPEEPTLLKIDSSDLTGSIDRADINVTVASLCPSMVSIEGLPPLLKVDEKVPGLPSYTGTYVATQAGSYALAVMKLQSGGLSSWYYDNVWFLDNPSVERIDASLNFDWGMGPITRYGRDYVSVRWWGKILPETTELYTFYMTCDDGGKLFIDHELLLDNWDGGTVGTLKKSIALEAFTFYDIKVEYKDTVGSAHLLIQWSSNTIQKQTIPSEQLYYSQHISGSPFRNKVTAGASDFPYSDILATPNEKYNQTSAGKPTHFYLQAKDAKGNLKTDDDYSEFPSDQFTVDFSGPAGESTGAVSYVQAGKYRVDYILFKAGTYTVHVRTGGTDIYCGLGESDKCSPFILEVTPGVTSSKMCEVESISLVADSLSEARAGETGTALIRAKDIYGNNQVKGGDTFDVKFTNTEKEGIQYRGYINDNEDGTYTLTYSIPVSGSYRLVVALDGKPIKHCSGIIPPLIHDRFYDGYSLYTTPLQCQNSYTLLTVVHGSLHPSSCTTRPWNNMLGLERAIAGTETGFLIESRDKFGNIRSGSRTNNIDNSGDGSSDAFIVNLTDSSGNKQTVSSSFVFIIRSADSNTMGYFRLKVAHEISAELPFDVSPETLQISLNKMHSNTLSTRVSRDTVDGNFEWRVTFLSHFEEITMDPLSVHPGRDGYDAVAGTLSIDTVAYNGIYPISYKVWEVGTYSLTIENKGSLISDQTFTVIVDSGSIHASSTTAYGHGLETARAGEESSFFVQTRDRRSFEVQVISLTTDSIPQINEVQEIHIMSVSGSTFQLMFRGETTSPLKVGFTSLSDLKVALESLPSCGNVSISSVSGQALIVTGDKIQVEFKTDLGVLPLLISSGPELIQKLINGQVSYRFETQVLECDGDEGEVTVKYFDTITNLYANDSSTDVSLKLSELLGCEVKVFDRSNTGRLCSPNGNIFHIQIEDFRDIEPLEIIDYEFKNYGVITVYGNGEDHKGAINGFGPLMGSFRLSYDGYETIDIAGNASAKQVQLALEALPSIGAVRVSKDSVDLCLDSTGRNLAGISTCGSNLWIITFGDESRGCNPPEWKYCPAMIGDMNTIQINDSLIIPDAYTSINQFQPHLNLVIIQNGTAGNIATDSDGNNEVSAYFIRSSDDSELHSHHVRMEYNDDGLYQLFFTAKLSGHYNIFIQVGDELISTDLSNGLTVVPARPNAVFSYHDAKLTAIVSEIQTFTITAVDKYGNHLTNNLDDKDEFLVSIIGSPHGCSSLSNQDISQANIDSSPHHGGRYIVSFLPSVAGLYEVSISLKSQGGLLTTYYRNSDFTDPVYMDHFTADLGEIWCQRESYKCDSTKLSETVDFNWGLDSPLSTTEFEHLNFPLDSFAVEWKGMIRSPVDGTVTFYIKLDGGAQLKIGNETIINSLFSSSDILSGRKELTKDEFYDLQLKYTHGIDHAYISLEWSVVDDGISAPIPSEYFYYSRHIGSLGETGISSPFVISSAPGPIDVRSFAYGNGLTKCKSNETCSFSIQTQDIYGNNRFSFGYELGFESSMIGISGWAGEGRVNDDKTNSNPISVAIEIQTLDWEFIGSFGAVHLSYALITNIGLDYFISEGDVLSIDGILYTVAQNAEAGDLHIVLADVYLGQTHESLLVYRVGGSCNTTGTLLASYRAETKGIYELDIRLPATYTIQRISTFTPSTTGISGSFILTYNNGKYNEFSTIEIPYNASEDFVTDALKGSPELQEVEVSRHDCQYPEIQCSWDVTFIGLSGHENELIPYWDGLLEGSQVSTTMLQVGRESLSISGFPRIVEIEAGDVDPAMTTAYGSGLQSATAGDKASFMIQPKDSFGNNVACNQKSEILWNVLAIPQDWNGDYGLIIRGNISEAANCLVEVNYLPKNSGEYNMIVTGTRSFERQNIYTSFNSFRREGTFTLILNTEVTSPIFWNASAIELKHSLEKLSSISSVVVSKASIDSMNFMFSVAFSGSVGDVPLLEVDTTNLLGNSGPWKIEYSDGYFEHIMTVPDNFNVPGRYNQSVLKSEIQSITIENIDESNSDDAITLSFMGHKTSIFVSANEIDLKENLESLPVIGDVDISIERRESSRIWYVTFTPWISGNTKNLLNFGDLPSIVPVSSLETVVRTNTIQDGISPFSLLVKARGPDPFNTLATDKQGRSLSEVGMSGLYKSLSSFQLHLRDQFSNYISNYPKSEVQILETSSETKIDGGFTLKFGSNEAVLPANASPDQLALALRNFASLEATQVTSNSARTLLEGVSMSVTKGKDTATPSSKLQDFEVGDWIRIGDIDGDIFTIIGMQEVPPFSVTLSRPYTGPTTSRASIYQHGEAGNRKGYQYIITFDHSLGDLPELVVNGTLLTGSAASARVVSCDKNRIFDLEIASSDNNELSGFFSIIIGHISTSYLSHDVAPSDLADTLISTFDFVHSVQIEPLYHSPIKKLWRMHFSNDISTILSQRGISVDGRFLISQSKTKVNAVLSNICPSGFDGEKSFYGVPGIDYVVELNGPELLYGDVVYADNGVYEVQYETPKVGEYKMNVQYVKKGGLLGEYFSNRWLFGEPVNTRVDKIIDFHWSEQEPITATGKDFVSIRWSGFVKPCFSEAYSFFVEANDGVRLWVGKDLLIDKYDTNVPDGMLFHEYNASTVGTLVADRLTEIKIEFRENRGDAKIRVMWESPSQPRSVISSNYLYSDPKHILGSPFSVKPLPIEPLEPRNVSVKVKDFDQVEISWEDPSDNGGEDIIEYLIEYWDASSPEDSIETVRFSLIE